MSLKDYRNSEVYLNYFEHIQFELSLIVIIYYKDANFNKLKLGFKGYLKSLLCLKSTIFVEILILSKYRMNANIMK